MMVQIVSEARPLHQVNVEGATGQIAFRSSPMGGLASGAPATGGPF